MNFRTIFVSLAASLPLVSSPQSAERPNQLPTATEVFHLRGECVVLAEKLRLAKDEKGRASPHYNSRDNRCYVTLSTETESSKFRAIFDGQTQIMIATAGMEATRAVVAKAGMFIKGPLGDYETVCAYMDKVMEEDDQCGELRTWWMHQLITGHKPT